MSQPAGPERAEILAILAEVGHRTGQTTSERIDSLELARLVYEVEHRHGVELDLDDEQLTEMSTVTGAAEVLRRVRTAAAVPGQGSR